MKKLFVMNEFISSSGNGVGTYIQQLINCLSGMNIRIEILLFNSEKDEFCIENSGGVIYFHFPSFKNKFIQKNHLIINKFLRLYIPDSEENLFMINYSPCSVLMKSIRQSHPQSKQIYVIHDMVWTLYLFGDVNKYVRILRQRMYKNVIEKYSLLLKSFEEEVEMCSYADKIICLSKDTYFLLEKHYPIDKQKLCLISNTLCKQVHLWPETKKTAFRKRMFIQKDDKILLYVGRMTEQKGFMMYIEAFKEIVKVYPSCRLVIIGSTTNWDYIRKYCYPVLAKIIFTGTLSANELDKWYQIADIGVLPSYTEQCSFVGLEMLAHGLPVIASDGFGLRCMFKEGINAKVASIGRRNYPNSFKNELIKSTLTLLASSSECERLSSNSLKFYKTNYPIERFKEIYNNLITDKG